MNEAKMKLSEAILKGISMRPKKAKGTYFSGEKRSDVLGAAYQGATGKAEVNNHNVGTFLDENFPLLAVKVHFPHDDSAKTASLKTVIRDLNDGQGWKRKNIARFVSAVEARHN